MALPISVDAPRWWAGPRLPSDASTSRRAGVVRPAGRALVLAAAGVTPVTLVAASTFGVGLRGAALRVAVPAAVVVALVAARHRPSAGLLREALVTGVVATFLYDLSRFAFLALGVVDRDPIPHIGVELGLEPPVVFGYLWRYLGNGAGLALAFLALRLRGRAVGVAYGLAVCGGLLVTLAVSPHGQDLLFPLGPGTVVMAVTGHVVFGAVLGTRSARPATAVVPESDRSGTSGPVRAPKFVALPGPSTAARDAQCL